jgi:serine/threonine protein kinase
LLNDEGELKLADFGVSTQLGRANSTVGTPLYMSPEVLDGAPYDARADIWSLGITAIELAEGQPPHANEHMLKAMVLISEGDGPELSRDTNRWSSEFRDFVRTCCAKRPTERSSAAQLLAHPFITKYSAMHRDMLVGLVEAFFSRKRTLEEEEIKIERQKLLLPDVEGFLQSLRHRRFDSLAQLVPAIAKLNGFVKDLVELCRFIESGKQMFVKKEAAEQLILRIATARQALDATRASLGGPSSPSGALASSLGGGGSSSSSASQSTPSLHASSSSGLAQSSQSTADVSSSSSSSSSAAHRLTEREWHDIQAKLADAEETRAALTQLQQRFREMEKTMAQLQHDLSKLKRK